MSISSHTSVAVLAVAAQMACGIDDVQRDLLRTPEQTWWNGRVAAPLRIARFDSRSGAIGTWQVVNPFAARTICPTVPPLFDAFEGDWTDADGDGSIYNPIGGDDPNACAMSGPSNRWYFGTGYCNTFWVQDFDVSVNNPNQAGWADGFCVGIEFYGDDGQGPNPGGGLGGSEQLFLIVETYDDFDSVGVLPAASNFLSGWILDYGMQPYQSGYSVFFAEFCSDFNGDGDVNALDGLLIPQDQHGALSVHMARQVLDTDGDGFIDQITSSSCGQPMFWGPGSHENGVSGPDPARVGATSGLEWDDVDPRNGSLDPLEFYHYYFGICPDPLTPMIGLLGPDACPTLGVADWDLDGVLTSSDALSFIDDYMQAGAGLGWTTRDPDLAPPFGTAPLSITGLDALVYFEAADQCANGDPAPTNCDMILTWSHDAPSTDVEPGDIVTITLTGQISDGIGLAELQMRLADAGPDDAFFGGGSQVEIMPSPALGRGAAFHQWSSHNGTLQDTDGDGTPEQIGNIDVFQFPLEHNGSFDPGPTHALYTMRWTVGTNEGDVVLDATPEIVPLAYESTGGSSANCPAASSSLLFHVIPPSPPPPPPPPIPQTPPPPAPSEPEEVLPKQLCMPADGQPNATDPVHLHSGEFYLMATDLAVRGRGLDFVWARRYGSRVTPDTAQGNGWDYSYNIHIEPDGPDVIVHNGWSRADTYSPSGAGWTSPGFFRELRQNPDTTYTLMFQDLTTWNFHPFDGSLIEGRVTSMIDRNGNIMSFSYDPLGRLATVTDTLNRDYSIAYDGNGSISSVTDFDGRSVTYDYYDGIEPGGNAGDLKTSTSPVVVGTPNANDFPSGKTTGYTYTTGFADERLNHNLLTITDPKGQTFIINEYATAVDEDDIAFDHVVRQTWGQTGDVLDIVYEEQTPSPANEQAILLTIVNDRMGNVQSHFFDAGARQVIARTYTGRWDPDTPTTSTDLGAPVTPAVRATDPAFFETRWTYNVDSLVTRIVHPNLNEEVFVHDESNPDPRARGNLLEHRRLPGPLGADQAVLVDTFEYETGFGGCCGSNFVSRQVDPRGHETIHGYDGSGNRLQTRHRLPGIVEDFEYNVFGQMTAHVHPDNGSGHRQRDEFTYYSSGPQRGYREHTIVDSTGFALTTTHGYDARGNTATTTDPRGNTTDLVINELNQVVRRLSRPVSTPNGLIRYTTDTFYDANDNIVRSDIQNVNDLGMIEPNTHFITTYEYEILNRRTASTSEVDETHSIRTEFEYDANRNQVLVRSGAAVSGVDPFNVTLSIYDERDLLFRTLRGAGSPQECTDQVDYDGNGNRVLVRAGLEGPSRDTAYAYDGYDRMVLALDAMGNVTTLTLDPNSNVVAQRVDGELADLPGSSGNVRLVEASYDYDPMDRRTSETSQFFNTLTQAPILAGATPDGVVVTSTVWSDRSQVLSVTDDNLHATSTVYDTAGRVLSVTDEVGNATTYTHDGNSNTMSIEERERDTLGGPDELYTTGFTYDALDRQISTVDNAGNTSSTAYDSRNNATRTIDALGNQARMHYDGLNRALNTVHDLTDDGTGAGAVVDAIVVEWEWDDASRLVSRRDPEGNRISHDYDALDRIVQTSYGDGTFHVSAYDHRDNEAQRIDANGSVCDLTYDLLDRLVSRVVTPGAGVSNDTTVESFQYDGLSRLVLAADDDSVVARAYDSMSNCTSESLSGVVTSCHYDGVGNEVQCVYPSGRTLDQSYDGINRLVAISEPGVGALATHEYVGPSRLTRRDLGNGIRTEVEYDGIANEPGDFGVRQPRRLRHTNLGSGAEIESQEFTWDRVGNKTRRLDLRAASPGFDQAFVYDSVYRLKRATTSDLGGVVRDRSYAMDRAGNRTSLTGSLGQGSYVLGPGDTDVNQYTRTPQEHQLHDANGNLVRRLCLADFNRDGAVNTNDFVTYLNAFVTQDPIADLGAPFGAINTADFVAFLNIYVSGCQIDRTFEYDYANRMVRHVDESGLETQYSYDALGRRIARNVDATGAALETRYLYDGWRVVEERDGGGTTTATYVTGLGPDDLVQMLRGAVEVWYHTDDLGNVLSLTDGSGNILERYAYDDFGQVLDPTTLASVAGDPSSVGNPHFSSGRRLDPETGFVYLRTRYLDPVSGRFTTRDRIGAWGDEANVGNAFTYVANNPWTMVDPFGTKGGKKGCCCCVEDLKLGKTKRYKDKPVEGGNHWGHEFTVDVKLQYKKTKKAEVKDCSLEWWERMDNVPKGHTGIKPGKWFDMHDYRPNSNTFKGWRDRNRKCGSRTASIKDIPGLPESSHKKKQRRVLEFVVVVRSAPNCGCAKDWLALTASQRLRRKEHTNDRTKDFQPGGVMPPPPKPLAGLDLDALKKR